MRILGVLALAVSLALAGATPRARAADDTAAQLRAMQQRLRQLEDRLAATADQLAAAQAQMAEQEKKLERAGLAKRPAVSSPPASFLQRLRIGGWVSASYTHNLSLLDNDALRGGNTGRFGTTDPHHPDSNTFSFDQLWFEVEHPVDEAHRAGFRADVLFGKTAGLLGTSSGGRIFGTAGDATDFYVEQAYVQYLAPVLGGVTLKAGKFSTLIGHEVVGAPYNENITRGLVWNLLQPIDHVGVLASGNLEGGFDWAFGVVNGFSPTDPDINSGKSLLGRIGFQQGDLAVAVSGLWGPERPRRENPKSSLVDLLADYRASDRLSLWLNADLARISTSAAALTSNSHALAWGVAAGGRYAVTARTGVAVRGEYVRDQRGLLSGGAGPHLTLYSLTGTVDHNLTDQLRVRGELRWDIGKLQSAPDRLFVDDVAFTKDDQLTAVAEVIYSFTGF